MLDHDVGYHSVQGQLSRVTVQERRNNEAVLRLVWKLEPGGPDWFVFLCSGC
jgi:hypothetical protein